MVGLRPSAVVRRDEVDARNAAIEVTRNKGTLLPSKGFAFIEGRPCSHSYPDEAGDPLFDIRRGQQRVRVLAPVQGQGLVKCLQSAWQWLRNLMVIRSDVAAPNQTSALLDRVAKAAPHAAGR